MLQDVQNEYDKVINKFTFFEKQYGTKSRLDYIFVSPNKYINIKSNIVEPFDSNKIDHKLVFAELTPNFCKRGPNYWKFNSNLLNDNGYCQYMKNIINECTKNTNI